MKVAGIDSASKNSGLALVVDGTIKKLALWNPSSDKISHPERLLEYRRWLRFKLRAWKPDMVAIEQLAVFQSKKTIRILSHFEADAIITAKEIISSVVLIQVTEARGIVFDKGNLSKDDAWDAIKKMHPDVDFGRKTTGGTDRADAAIVALAAPSFIERG